MLCIIAFSTFKLMVKMLFLLVVVLKSMITYKVTALMPVIAMLAQFTEGPFFNHLLFNV